MKDNMTLIAAAAGGFMLSVALSGILRGTPVVSWQQQSSLRPATVADLKLMPSEMEENGELFPAKTSKKQATW